MNGDDQQEAYEKIHGTNYNKMNHLIEEALERKQYTSNITQLEQEALDRGDFLYWDNPGYDEDDEIDRLVKQIKALNVLMSELNEDMNTLYKLNRAQSKLLKKLL